jgi:hypothetical protein
MTSHSLLHLIALSSAKHCLLQDLHKSLSNPRTDTNPEDGNCSVFQNRKPLTFYMIYSQKLKSYIL